LQKPFPQQRFIAFRLLLFQAQSQYVLTTQQLQGGTVRLTSRNGSASASNVHPMDKTLPLSAVNGSGRPHITLNPYSTQLVDNINMMMPDVNNKQLLGLTKSLKRGQHQNNQEDDYVYRAVSPHGHVYWEIDPNYVVLSQQQQQRLQQQQPLLLEGQVQQLQQQQQLQLQLQEQQLQQQQIAAAETSGDTSSSRESSSRFASEQRPLISSPLRPSTISSNNADFGGVSSSFVRTGANRFNRTGTRTSSRPVDLQQQQQQQHQQQQGVEEQLQTQVQIRDCKAIAVSVKSSEYIEAKIRTLRKNNNIATIGENR
jgi:isopentenyldiphosphate isomerase